MLALKRTDEVVRQAGQQVDDEPRLEVVEANDARVGDDFAGRTDERRVEIDEDVDEEDDVDDGIDDKDGRRVAVRLVVERHVVRHHDGRVERQQQYQPVPLRLEYRVV